MDIDNAVLDYLDRCQRVGRQEMFSELVATSHSLGTGPDDIYRGIRWLFDREYAIRTRPDQFTLADGASARLLSFAKQKERRLASSLASLEMRLRDSIT